MTNAMIHMFNTIAKYRPMGYVTGLLNEFASTLSNLDPTIYYNEIVILAVTIISYLCVAILVRIKTGIFKK